MDRAERLIHQLITLSGSDPAAHRAVRKRLFRASKPRYKRGRGRKYTLIYERDGGICQECGDLVSYEDGTLDHVRPYSHKGSGDPENLALAHSECNLLKGNDYECECGLPPNGPGCRNGVEEGWREYADNLERRMWYEEWQRGGPRIREWWVET